MKLINIGIALLCMAWMATSCSDETENGAATATDVAQLIKIGDFPAFSEGASSRAIGTPDAGKTAWTAGDKVLLKLQLKEEGVASGAPYCYVLTYDAYDETAPAWKADKPFTLTFQDYNNRTTTADITAYYAPAYGWDTENPGNIKLTEGKTAGTDEFLTYKKEDASLDEGITITFQERAYSRLRVVATANGTVALTCANFTPAGDATAALGTNTLTATADAEGNAFFYGSWQADSEANLSVNGGREDAYETSKTIAESSTSGQSYVWMSFTASMQFTILGDIVKLPFAEETTPAKLIVYWGDGTTTTVEAGTKLNDEITVHTYNYWAETHQITIVSAQTDYTKQQIPPLNFVQWRYNYACSLRSLDTPLLNTGEASSFRFCFQECENLTEIPEDLFVNNTKATDFTGCFYGCKKLTGIPENLFAKNTKATTFEACFYKCNGLTAIPGNLFAQNTKATNFGQCFTFCGELTGIPGDLFAKNTEATNFLDCFRDCSKLTAIPGNLFVNNTKATNFQRCFCTCTSLTTIPDALFVNNTAATNFFCCFSSCYKLVLNEKIFIDGTQTPEVRFAAVSPDLSYCFRECNGGGGTAPNLWEYTYKDGTVKSTDCFVGCTSATNYSAIPTAWGGTN